MYKYQCSKQDCNSMWVLEEGKLNGFVLTCPICGKGRGIFVSQIKGEKTYVKSKRTEVITIAVDANKVNSEEEIEQILEGYQRNHSLTIVDNEIERTKDEVIFRIQYKLRDKGA